MRKPYRISDSNNNTIAYHCKHCKTYKKSKAFWPSSIRHGKKICKLCAKKKKKTKKRDNYDRVLAYMKRKYKEMNKKAPPRSFIVEKKDVIYLMNSVWGNKSVVTSSMTYDEQELVLVMWDRNRYMSPWNCVCMTKKEANKHKFITDVYSDVYSKGIITTVVRRLNLVKDYYRSQLLLEII